MDTFWRHPSLLGDLLRNSKTLWVYLYQKINLNHLKNNLAKIYPAQTKDLQLLVWIFQCKVLLCHLIKLLVRKIIYFNPLIIMTSWTLKDKKFKWRNQWVRESMVRRSTQVLNFSTTGKRALSQLRDYLKDLALLNLK